MISERIQKVLNKQINLEFASSYLYLSMSAYLELENFKGLAHWMKIQSEEEYGHAMKIYDYLVRTGGRAILDVLEKPKAEWDNPSKVFDASYKHELVITESINKIVNLAVDERDHATQSFLRFFVDEQVEEMQAASDIVEKFKMIGDSKHMIFWMDKELGKREKK